MKKLPKILAFVVLGVVAIILIAWVGFNAYYGIKSYRNMAKLGVEAPALTNNGVTLRDLNKNGILDPYEDPNQSIDQRIEDILTRMSIEEKAGMMFITMIATGQDGDLAERPVFSDPMTLMMTTMFPSNSEFVASKLMNHFNVLAIPRPRNMATWSNNIQKLAERTRLGIPVTIATDPRHGFSINPGTSLEAGAFSQWCEPIGLAATRDTVLVRQFANIARQEYLAMGIRLALHPMADLSTEPRWPRISGTFGENAELSASMVYAYVKGFQGETLGPNSVACITKHFSGGGPQKDGLDPHFEFGKEQVYPGNNFDYHLIPFEKGAFPAGTAQIMPYYGIPMGQTSEDVGFAFNKDIITDLLRDRYNFDGVVCSDWSLLTDKGSFLKATGWGVEHLSVEERIVKALDAGIDQFGGENLPEVIVDIVEQGLVSESRIDQSVRRLLRDKFRLGLFDDPYVDPDFAERIVGKPEFKAAGELAQRKSIVLLKNEGESGSQFLPITNRPKIYVENMEASVVSQYGTVVETPQEADLAILRLNSPFEPSEERGFESFFHHGDLDFKDPEKSRILGILKTVPTIVDIYMDRPAVVPEISAKSKALLANFGANDGALLDIVFGRVHPTGKLPFELPSSMDAVEAQLEDVPYDSEDPLYPFGHGLSYGLLASE